MIRRMMISAASLRMHVFQMRVPPGNTCYIPMLHRQSDNLVEGGHIERSEVTDGALGIKQNRWSFVGAKRLDLGFRVIIDLHGTHHGIVKVSNRQVLPRREMIRTVAGPIGCADHDFGEVAGVTEVASCLGHVALLSPREAIVKDRKGTGNVAGADHVREV